MQLAIIDDSRNLSWSDLREIDKNFDKKSLLAQIIDIAGGIDFGVRTGIFHSVWAVFTDEEVQIIFELFKPLVGDLQQDRGMGHVIPGWYLEFSQILKRLGYCLRYECFEPNQPQLCFSPM